MDEKTGAKSKEQFEQFEQGEEKMKLAISLISALCLTVLFGCTPSYKSPSAGYQSNSVPQPAPAPAPEPEENYEYPHTVDNFNDIYNRLKNIKRDEYTTDAEVRSLQQAEIDKIMTGKKYLVFKALPKKGQKTVPIWYNNHQNDFYIDPLVGRFRANKAGIVVRNNEKVVRKTGYNAFGVSNTYDDHRGTRDIVFYKNENTVWSIPVKHFQIDSDLARQLKDNTEVFLISELAFPDDKYMEIAIKDFDAETPTINSIAVNHFDVRVLTCKIIAMLICDKRKKEVVKVVRWRRS